MAILVAKVASGLAAKVASAAVGTLSFDMVWLKSVMKVAAGNAGQNSAEAEKNACVAAAVAAIEVGEKVATILLLVKEVYVRKQRMVKQTMEKSRITRILKDMGPSPLSELDRDDWRPQWVGDTYNGLAEGRDGLVYPHMDIFKYEGESHAPQDECLLSKYFSRRTEV